MTTSNLILRETVIKAIRQFFDERGFHEVITPVLSEAIPTEPNLYPFTTVWNTTTAKRTLYLSTSPERSLKLHLAKLGNCFAIGHSFRNLEQDGPHHNPEFLMLEWYRRDATYQKIMQDTQELIQFVMHDESNTAWPIFSLEELFAKHAKLAIDQILDDESLRQEANIKGYNTANAAWDEIFDQIFLNEVLPHLPHGPFFLVDFPARMSPLCATQAAKPYLAQRFEVYAGGMEIGNGNTEGTDANLVRKSMQTEIAKRHTDGLAVSPLDEPFLAALDQLHSSEYAGIGLGVDRLCMLVADSQDIAEISPHLRPSV